MNRYPLWKYLLLAFALVVGLVYTLPNFYGEAPAVQVSSGKPTLKVDSSMVGRVEQALTAAGIQADFVQFDGNSVKARFADTDTQIKAKDALTRVLNPDREDASYIIALNLLSRTPQWLSHLRILIAEPKPMYLGLDLRGGVHFLMQVDMQAALTKRAETTAGEVRSLLREKSIRHSGVSRSGTTINIQFRDEAVREAARNALLDAHQDMLWTNEGLPGGDLTLKGNLKPDALLKVQEAALKQNITTLHNRVNELGVSEPVIQQQGLDRVVVQLPGVQDTARAKDIIGRTATLEVHMVEAHASSGDARDYSPQKIEDARKGIVPAGTELHVMKRGDRGDEYLLLSKQTVFTGDDLTRADPTPDQQGGTGWLVNISLNSRGGNAMKETTHEGVKRRMAVVLIEKNKPEVLTAPVIQSELSDRFNISGMRNAEEANTLALLMRAGSLAAPMEIIEERTIGPSLGAENIGKGLNSVLYGFAAIAVFMCLYYLLFGMFSTLALAFNLLMLIAVLSLMQATLSLPGIAAIALALGMAIDSNVLINERVREELRAGASAQAAIAAGYERAWATILDSNITTLIAGLALLAFGSGPIRGFAMVHCLGIVTSMFSAVMFSRGLVNLWYGRQKKLKSVSIGQVWRPNGTPEPAADNQA